MSTEQPAATPVNLAYVASPAFTMELDLQTFDLAVAQISGDLKTMCTTDVIRAMNGLAPAAPSNANRLK